jgi:exodeoxyribonuclease VII small subunit
MKEEMSYEQALHKLEEIVSEIEDGETGIDMLTEKIKEASELLKFCKEKLTATEQNVEDILRELDD